VKGISEDLGYFPISKMERLIKAESGKTPTIVNEFVKKIIGELEQDKDEQTVEKQRKSRTA